MDSNCFGERMPRPSHLADYGSPPLNEVVVGVQFRPATGYQQIFAGDVWKLFRDQFPVVEEQQRIRPSFETFGPIPVQHPQFEFVQGAEHDRFWFLTKNGAELIQFQSDRLLHNWRKPLGVETEYPRFERMIETFRGQTEKLEQYFKTLSPQKLELNQCEVTYINHFPIDQFPDFKGLQDYIDFVRFDGEMPDDAMIRYRRTIRSPEGNPTGRLYCETGHGVTVEGKQIITLSLTARGAPEGSDIQSAIEYLTVGRDMIVTEFTNITTDKAHKLWNRIS
jgi:uncharacterized protein (TIGR04255 family)